MQFEKMIQFSRLVKAEGRLREYNFRKIKVLMENCLV